jgi:hypothetical protein
MLNPQMLHHFLDEDFHRTKNWNWGAMVVVPEEGEADFGVNHHIHHHHHNSPIPVDWGLKSCPRSRNAEGAPDVADSSCPRATNHPSPAWVHQTNWCSCSNYFPNTQEEEHAHWMAPDWWGHHQTDQTRAPAVAREEHDARRVGAVAAARVAREAHPLPPSLVVDGNRHHRRHRPPLLPHQFS